MCMFSLVYINKLFAKARLNPAVLLAFSDATISAKAINKIIPCAANGCSAAILECWQEFEFK